MGQSIINSEMEILTSFDLAKEAAKDIGPDKILAKYGGGNDPLAAAAIIKKNLVVEAPKQDSVIHVVYMDADPTVVQPVLSEIISDYLDKHLQVHESSMSDDYLAQETAQLRSQIDETEDELRAAKMSAGIISLPDAEKSYTDQIGWLKSQLFGAEADLAADESELKAQPEQQTNAAAPAPGLRVRVETAVTSWDNDRWMSLSGRPPMAAMHDAGGWRKMRLGDSPKLIESAPASIPPHAHG